MFDFGLLVASCFISLTCVNKTHCRKYETLLDYPWKLSAHYPEWEIFTLNLNNFVVRNSFMYCIYIQDKP